MKLSKKRPIALAIAWKAISSASSPVLFLFFSPRGILEAELWVRALIAAGVLLFSIVMMSLVHATSRKSQIKWLSVVSKILLIFYAVALGLLLLLWALRLLQ